MSKWIDSTGSRPSLKSGAVATGVLGTLVYGVYWGIIDWIDRVTSFWISTITGADNFVGDVYSSIISGIVLSSRTAASQNAAWLLDLGTIGILVGFIEGILIVYFVAWTAYNVPIWVISNI